MKILAVDDEKLALDSMADAIREASPEAELFTFQKPKEVLAWAEKHSGCGFSRYSNAWNDRN